MSWNVRIFTLLWVVFFSWSCKNHQQEAVETEESTVEASAPIPFSADSAYQYIETQVKFGPRVPGSQAQQQCADWLVNTLKRFGAEVTVQRTTVKAHDGKVLPCINIIGSYNTNASKRMLLGAHWDSRPRADQDVRNTDQPIDGANDGASGVGVLLEMARQFQTSPPTSGVDIIFFDVEDYGISGENDSYCLGSQYWAKNPHKPGYTASNGILLDMVGAKGAQFTMEGSSMQIAPDFVRQVWRKAHALGHGKFFLFRETGPIVDDHVYVFKYSRIPMIDIIQYDPSTPTGFGKYWHTHDDNMGVISKETLQAVGETVLGVIYEY